MTRWLGDFPTYCSLFFVHASSVQRGINTEWIVVVELWSCSSSFLFNHSDVIDEARAKFVDTGQLTKIQFTRTFSVKLVARRLINASVAADVNPRGSQGRSREPDPPALSRGTQLPFPAKYLSMPREKQLSMVRYAREAQALETREQNTARKYDKELRDMNKAIAALRTRVEDMGIAPLDSQELDAREIWNDINDKRVEFRVRQEQLVKADEVEHANSVNKIQIELEHVRKKGKGSVLYVRLHGRPKTDWVCCLSLSLFLPCAAFSLGFP